MKEATSQNCPMCGECEKIEIIDGEKTIVRCQWYIKMKGKNPSTGEDFDDWRCAVAWMPVLLVNAANESRKGAIATDSFRNAMVNQNNVRGILSKLPKINR